MLLPAKRRKVALPASTVSCPVLFCRVRTEAPGSSMHIRQEGGQVGCSGTPGNGWPGSYPLPCLSHVLWGKMAVPGPSAFLICKMEVVQVLTLYKARWLTLSMCAPHGSRCPRRDMPFFHPADACLSTLSLSQLQQLGMEGTPGTQSKLNTEDRRSLGFCVMLGGVPSAEL